MTGNCVAGSDGHAFCGLLLGLSPRPKARSALPTFEDILAELERSKIKGIGQLTVYDTATMLAFPLGKFPQKVYLHAGTAKGARALEVKGGAVDKQVFVDICPNFQDLSPAQIEDFLCVYSAYLLQDEVAMAKIKRRTANCGSRCRLSNGGC